MNEKHVVGSKQWADGVRKEAKTLVDDLERGYMRLAELLYNINDVPVDGDAMNGPTHVRWQYASFKEYVETELGIHHKKAQRLRNIWFNIEVRLAGKLDPTLKDRLAKLGFTKAREIVPVMTAANAEEWISLAESVTYKQLNMKVRRHKEEVEAAKDNSNTSTEASTETTSTSGGGGGGGGGDGLPKAVDTVMAENEASLGNSSAEVAVPSADDDDLVRENFMFYKDQHEQVKQALDIAQKLSGSTVKSNNMHLVCMEYVATNDTTGVSRKQKLQRLHSLAKLYGLDLIVVDRDDVVSGHGVLERLAEGA